MHKFTRTQSFVAKLEKIPPASSDGIPKTSKFLEYGLDNSCFVL